MEVFDLTRPLVAGMPVLRGDPAVVIETAVSYETAGYSVSSISLGSHSGTHLDAPRHFFPDGATLDSYPPGRFVRRGVLLDVRPEAGDLPDGPPAIDSRRLAEVLYAAPVQPGDFVLLWTEGASLSLTAAQLLLEIGAGLVGTDGPSLDDEPYPVHRLLLGHDVLIAENLCGLERLGPEPVTCAFLPLAVAGADGAPMRAIAWR